MSKHWLNSTTKNLTTPGSIVHLVWTASSIAHLVWTPVYTGPKSGTETYQYMTIHFQDPRGVALLTNSAAISILCVHRSPLWFLCLGLKCHPSLRPAAQRAERVWYRPFEGGTKRRMAFQTIRVCARATWFFVQKGTG